MCVLIFCKDFSETFFVLRLTERDTVSKESSRTHRGKSATYLIAE